MAVHGWGQVPLVRVQGLGQVLVALQSTGGQLPCCWQAGGSGVDGTEKAILSLGGVIGPMKLGPNWYAMELPGVPCVSG